MHYRYYIILFTSILFFSCLEKNHKILQHTQFISESPTSIVLECATKRRTGLEKEIREGQNAVILEIKTKDGRLVLQDTLPIDNTGILLKNGSIVHEIPTKNIKNKAEDNSYILTTTLINIDQKIIVDTLIEDILINLSNIYHFNDSTFYFKAENEYDKENESITLTHNYNFNQAPFSVYLSIKDTNKREIYNSFKDNSYELPTTYYCKNHTIDFWHQFKKLKEGTHTLTFEYSVFDETNNRKQKIIKTFHQTINIPKKELYKLSLNDINAGDSGEHDFRLTSKSKCNSDLYYIIKHRGKSIKRSKTQNNACTLPPQTLYIKGYIDDLFTFSLYDEDFMFDDLLTTITISQSDTTKKDNNASCALVKADKKHRYKAINK